MGNFKDFYLRNKDALLTGIIVLVALMLVLLCIYIIVDRNRETNKDTKTDQIEENNNDTEEKDVSKTADGLYNIILGFNDSGVTKALVSSGKNKVYAKDMSADLKMSLAYNSIDESKKVSADGSTYIFPWESMKSAYTNIFGSVYVNKTFNNIADGCSCPAQIEFVNGDYSFDTTNCGCGTTVEQYMIFDKYVKTDNTIEIYTKIGYLLNDMEEDEISVYNGYDTNIKIGSVTNRSESVKYKNLFEGQKYTFVKEGSKYVLDSFELIK